MKKNEKIKFGDNKITKILQKYNYKVKKNDFLTGQIIGIERIYTLLNLGLLKASFLHKNEIFIGTRQNKNNFLQINKIMEFIILNDNLHKNKTIISICKINYLYLWDRFKQLDLKNMHLYTQFEKRVYRGIIVSFDSLHVFIPNYHLTKLYKKFKNTSKKLKSLQIKILEVKIKSSVNERFQNIIIGSIKLSLFKKYTLPIFIGLIRMGIILKIKKYGIFINIFGIKCLLHISELSNKKGRNIFNLYKKGDVIKIKIIYINTSEAKIALSKKFIE